MGKENTPSSSESGSREQLKQSKKLTKAELANLGQDIESKEFTLNGERFIDWNLKEKEEASVQALFKNYRNNILFLAKKSPQYKNSVSNEFFRYLNKENQKKASSEFLEKGIQKNSKEGVVFMVNIFWEGVTKWLKITKFQEDRQKGVFNKLYMDTQIILRKNFE